MENNSIFFERILQIIDYYNIKSVNSFACDYLKYDSSEKINRLKKKNTSPSFEILNDIANKFVEIDMNWLVLGVGNMIKNQVSVINPDVKVIDNSSFNFIMDRYEALAIENGYLKKENEDLKDDLKHSRGKSNRTINYANDQEKLNPNIAAEPKHK